MIGRIGIRLALIVMMAGLLVGCGRGGDDYPQLPEMQLDSERFYVSGLSSGGYMAQQLHLAWPSEVKGVAVFAAGPYGCARDGVNAALLQCMATTRGRPDVGALVNQARVDSREGKLGDLQQLKESRVFIYRAEFDPLIHAPVSQATVDFYKQLVPEGQLQIKLGSSAGHGLPTQDQGVACSETRSPYVNACGFSGVGLSLDHLDSRPNRSVSSQPKGELKQFSQSPFSENSRGMADFGYYYQPPACDGSANCGLQMVLHGCEQGAEKLETEFVEKSGYLQQADARGLVLVFPQVQSTLPNPKGCWDWWGYESSAFDTREGPQVEGLRAIWSRLLNESSAE
jgi:poly(3-hydroxybutyrate) depolymerase